MRFLISILAFVAALSSSCAAIYDERAIFSTKNGNITKNSGICETTNGVNQYSGYLNVGEGMQVWFW
jgi:hypothetical protein